MIKYWTLLLPLLSQTAYLPSRLPPLVFFLCTWPRAPDLGHALFSGPVSPFGPREAPECF